MPVPLLDLKAQYATIRDEIYAAMERVIESQYFILGPEVVALARPLAGSRNCTAGWLHLQVGTAHHVTRVVPGWPAVGVPSRRAIGVYGHIMDRHE